MENIVSYIIHFMTNIRIQDIVDIAVITFFIYRVFIFLKQTRAEQLIKGIVVLVVLTKMSEWLQLFTVNWILSEIVRLGTFAIIVVFQPELRRGLEYLGRSSVIPKNLKDMEKEDTNKTVKAITDAVGSLARQKIGAIIIIEKKVGLNEYIESGTLIDGDVSAELLINIFIPNTPLHDGAVIIRGDKIVAAACFLPLSDNTSISKEMGTRHRAALGISEKSDSLSIVVSEETGIISIAENGKISRHLDVETLEQILNKIYTSTDDSAFAGFWRNINEQDKANIDK